MIKCRNLLFGFPLSLPQLLLLIVSDFPEWLSTRLQRWKFSVTYTLRVGGRSNSFSRRREVSEEGENDAFVCADLLFKLQIKIIPGTGCCISHAIKVAAVHSGPQRFTRQRNYFSLCFNSPVGLLGGSTKRQLHRKALSNKSFFSQTETFSRIILRCSDARNVSVWSLMSVICIN